MNKAKVAKLQEEFCLKLISRINEKSFQLDKKEWSIFNEEVVFPFFAASVQGPFFTIEPSFRVQISDLKLQINNIVSRNILSCGIFILGLKLDKVLGVENINDLIRDNKCKERIGKYYWQIYDVGDIKWMVDWFDKYLELGGWDLIEKLKCPKCIYDFYKKIFMNFLNDPSNLNIFERSLSLDADAHITMLYLGLKNNFPGINELLELTLEHKKGKLYQEPTIELLNHFSDKKT